MSDRCEATKLQAKWTRGRCKRNATTVVDGRRYCEQHAKIAVGMAAGVRLDSRAAHTEGDAILDRLESGEARPDDLTLDERHILVRLFENGDQRALTFLAREIEAVAPFRVDELKGSVKP